MAKDLENAMDNETWARALSESLPYFRQYVGRTVVSGVGSVLML